MQKNIFKKFNYSLEKTSKEIDNIRKSLFKKNTFANITNLKILHIASFNESSNGSLFYSTANKFNIGFTKLSHFVQILMINFF